MSSLFLKGALGETEISFFPDPAAVFDGRSAGGILICDENTRPLLKETPSIVLAPGETSKSWDSIETILGEACERHLDRSSTFWGVGGGVITDMTAFAASLYMRGCRLVLVPTTLLAMVDAAIGGKTGIDFCGSKNLVGTFYPAGEVRICLGFLQSLPEKEYRSGLAEVIKHALLADRGLLALLRDRREAVLQRNPAVLEELVRRSIAVKLGIVEADLREEGQRAFLNLGHTFGHALEAATGFQRYTHGEAVAWGIGKALQAGLSLGVTDPQMAREAAALLRSYGYRLEGLGVPADDCRDALYRDKKRRDGELRFVLLADWFAPIRSTLSEALLDRLFSDDPALSLD